MTIEDRISQLIEEIKIMEQEQFMLEIKEMERNYGKLSKQITGDSAKAESTKGTD